MALPNLAALRLCATGANDGPPPASRRWTGDVDDGDDEEVLPDVAEELAGAMAAMGLNPLAVLPPEVFGGVLRQLLSDYDGATFYHSGMCRRMHNAARAWVVSKAAPTEDAWAFLYSHLEEAELIPIAGRPRPSSDDPFLAPKEPGTTYEAYFAEACRRARRQRALLLEAWKAPDSEASERVLLRTWLHMIRMIDHNPQRPYVTLLRDEPFILGLVRSSPPGIMDRSTPHQILFALVADSNYYAHSLKVVKAAIQHVQLDLYRMVDEKVRSDKALAEYVIREGGYRMFGAVADALKDDMEFVGLAMDVDARASQWASDRLKRSNARVVASEIRLGRIAFRDADPALRQVLTVVLAAVEANGRSLEFVEEPLRSDRLVALAAVASDGRALEFVPHRLINKFPGIARNAIRQNRGYRAFRFIPPEVWQTDAEVAVVCLRMHLINLQQVPQLNDNRIVVLAAVRTFGRQIRYASKRLQQDLEIVATALHEEPSAEAYLDREVVKEALIWAVRERKEWLLLARWLHEEYGLAQ